MIRAALNPGNCVESGRLSPGLLQSRGGDQASRLLRPADASVRADGLALAFVPVGVDAVKLGSKFAKQFGVRNEILVPHVNNWFARGIFPDEIQVIISPNKEKDRAFHPSSDAIGCAREIYAQRNGFTPEFKPSLELRKAFMYGHYVHGLLYTCLLDLGFTTEEQIEYKIERHDKDLWVKGHVDVACCEIPGQDEPLVIDIKTQNGYAFNSPLHPKPDDFLFQKYLAQTRVYMYFLNRSRTIIFWAEKDSPHGYKETIVEEDPVFVADVLEKWAMVAAAERAGAVPDCTCGLLACPGTQAIYPGILVH